MPRVCEPWYKNRMLSQRAGANYYEILEVAPDAPQNEIHRAYQKAKQTYSQDNPALYSMFSKEEARELVRMIEEAYQILGNQAARRKYDDSVGAPPEAAPAADASAHAALPDLAFRDADGGFAAGNGEFNVRTLDAPKPSLAPGQGRTSLSTYKIDDAIEAEIADRGEWDGAFVARVRQYKNVTLEKMSEATRVSRAYLSALEADDYANLPAQVFVRGFVAQCARILGLDENKVAGSYMKRFKAAAGAKK